MKGALQVSRKPLCLAIVKLLYFVAIIRIANRMAGGQQDSGGETQAVWHTDLKPSFKYFTEYAAQGFNIAKANYETAYSEAPYVKH